MAKISFTNAEFIALRKKAETEYDSIGKVNCPYLGTKVAFNAKGFEHLRLKRWNHGRPRKDQYTRLKLIHCAPEIIRRSHTLQGYCEGNRMERIKINNRWELRSVFVRYYEFIGVMNGCRVRVVVKKVQSGQPYFWSLVPYWKQKPSGGKDMFEGNPEED